MKLQKFLFNFAEQIVLLLLDSGLDPLVDLGVGKQGRKVLFVDFEVNARLRITPLPRLYPSGLDFGLLRLSLDQTEKLPVGLDSDVLLGLLFQGLHHVEVREGLLEVVFLASSKAILFRLSFMEMRRLVLSFGTLLSLVQPFVDSQPAPLRQVDDLRQSLRLCVGIYGLFLIEFLDFQIFLIVFSQPLQKGKTGLWQATHLLIASNRISGENELFPLDEGGSGGDFGLP